MISIFLVFLLNNENNNQNMKDKNENTISSLTPIHSGTKGFPNSNTKRHTYNVSSSAFLLVFSCAYACDKSYETRPKFTLEGT